MKKISILALDFAVASTITGPMDVFHQVGVLWNHVCRKKPTPHFDVSVVSINGQPIKCLGGISIEPHCSLDQMSFADLIIISSISNIEKSLHNHPEIPGWLLEQHEKGSQIASICTGSFLLAETGLLNGKNATTHWGFSELFKRRYPHVHLKPENIITDEGDLFCSGGVNSGIDLSVYLVEKFCGHKIALQCSKAMVHDYVRSSQAPYCVTISSKNHPDKTILAIQDHIENHYAEKVDYEILAQQFKMSRRTLERRFKEATGDTPLLYLQRFRVEMAKQLLEEDSLSFDEISYQVGYEDSIFLRRLFVRHTGLRPKEYREKFNSRNQDLTQNK